MKFDRSKTGYRSFPGIGVSIFKSSDTTSGIFACDGVEEPHVRHIRGRLWEIRLKGKAGIARALYVTAKEQRVVIVRAFIKKAEKTPTGEIDLALQRAKELKP